MIADSLVPSFHLPPLCSVRWRTANRLLRLPEENWPLELLEKFSVSGTMGDRSVVFFSSPDAIQVVLRASRERFDPIPLYRKMLIATSGKNNILFTPELENLHRKIISYILDVRRTDELVVHCIGEVKRASRMWKADSGKIKLNLNEDLSPIALSAIWRFLFRVAPLADISANVPELILRASRLMKTSQNKDATLAVSALASLGIANLDRVLNPTKFLEQERKEIGEERVAAVLHDNVRLFLNGGLETAPTLVGWALWFVSLNQDLQEKISLEIKMLDQMKTVDSANLDKLRCVNQILKECLRLLPPGAVTIRQSKEDQVVCGTRVPKGAVVVVPFYILHRHRLLWRDGDSFRPERFGPDSDDQPIRGAFLPFSAGTFGCMGPRLGWLMAIAILVSILSRWKVEPVDPMDVPQLILGASLHAKTPLKVILRRREI